MNRLNIVKGVVSGGAETGSELPALARCSFLTALSQAAGVRGSEDTPLPDIECCERPSRTNGCVCLRSDSQYAGLSLSDPPYEPYLALAEEFDIPVALHTGMVPQAPRMIPAAGAPRETWILC